MIENRISGYLHNKLFSEINEEKCTISQSMAWSLIVHINTDRNCSTALQAFSFRSISFRVHNLGCNVKGQGSGTPGPPARYAPAVNRCLFLAKNLSPLFRKRWNVDGTPTSELVMTNLLLTPLDFQSLPLILLSLHISQAKYIILNSFGISLSYLFVKSLKLFGVVMCCVEQLSNCK